MVVSEFESQWGHSAPRDGDGSDEGGDGGYDDEHAMKMFRQSAYCIDLSTHMPPPPCHLSKPELLTLTPLPGLLPLVSSKLLTHLTAMTPAAVHVSSGHHRWHHDTHKQSAEKHRQWQRTLLKLTQDLTPA